MSVAVRPALAGDVSAIAALEKACFSRPWSEQSVREELENPNARLFVAEEDGAVLGYAGMQTAADEGYVLNVAVDPAARRRGIGRQLVAVLRDTAVRCGLTFLTLELRAGNAPAAALYAAFGFESVGRRPNYYDDPREDAVLMTLRIGESQ